MNTFALHIASATQQTRFEAIASFVGSDASGQFGLMSGHVPMATILEPGLARFRESDEAAWRYLAQPGGTLHFADNMLTIATRSFVIGDELTKVRAELDAALDRETRQHADLRHNLDQLENALAQRLWDMERP
ncbi:MAG: hypothetical protein CVU19_00735 [Betaproteobacteria bacterium HGW-Betaproteobacteria-13]|jgi:F-type H+-transporting ATPase subunit epsilon|nr:MAG: hypothetical protein CVU19_00735 [Betaproteobacteria bacterium HGW-Betaproteobacteria-13]